MTNHNKTMNKIITVLAIVCIAAFAATCVNAGPAKKSNAKKTTQKATPKKAKSESVVTNMIASFRYELYKGGESEVYYYTNNAGLKSSQFYTRDMGSSIGWTYTVNDNPIKPLSLLAQELQLGKYPMTKLDDEDTARDRWIIEVKYVNGNTVSIVSYLSNETATVDAMVQQKCEAAFKAIAIEDKDGKKLGEFTKTIYADGKRVKEVYYTADGIVRGGQDFNRPQNDGPLEYGVPEAPGKLY